MVPNTQHVSYRPSELKNKGLRSQTLSEMGGGTRDSLPSIGGQVLFVSKGGVQISDPAGMKSPKKPKKEENLSPKKGRKKNSEHMSSFMEKNQEILNNYNLKIQASAKKELQMMEKDQKRQAARRAAREAKLQELNGEPAKQGEKADLSDVDPPKKMKIKS